MDQVTGFTYGNYVALKQEDMAVAVVEPAATEVATTATADDDNDHIYNYVAMREPDPAKDAQPVALVSYPQFTYAYPQQQQISAQPEQLAAAYASVETSSSKQVAVAAPPPVMAVAQQQQPVFAYAQPAYTYAYAMPNYPVPVYNPGPAVKTTTAPASETKKVTETKKVETKKSGLKSSAKITTTEKVVAAKSEKSSSEKAASTKVSTKTEAAKPTWVGRTKKQVDEDNIKVAINEGIYNPNEIVPKDAKADQLFWVVETDGSNTLRTFQTIEAGDLGKGVWKIDPRYGNAYFVRAKEEKEKVLKEKK